VETSNSRMFKKVNWMEADVNYSEVIPAFGGTGKNKESLTQEGILPSAVKLF
jgi:hypothetical protein